MSLGFKFLRCRKGLETVTAVLMLLLMFALISALVASFYNYNVSTKQQFTNEEERSKEQITLANHFTDQGGTLHATITNTGTIEVTIKALYKKLDDQVTFFCDPSTYTPDTHIPVGGSLTLSFPSAVTLNPEEKIVVATERGVKAMDPNTPPTKPIIPIIPDTNRYVYGDIELKWINFSCKTWDSGIFDPEPLDGWTPGWTVENPQKNIAWKVTIKNISTKGSIVINGNSTLTLDPIATGSGANPARRSWYLYSEPTTQPQTATLPVDTEVDVYFVWSSTDATNYQGIYSQQCVCMAFLTFFGYYTSGTPYAQTIPFEAAVTVA